MTANEARQITNKVREDWADSILDEIIEKSEEKIESAAEAGLTFTIVEVRCHPIDEESFKQRVCSYFEQLGYKVTCSMYDFGGRCCQVRISWEDNNGV